MVCVLQKDAGIIDVKSFSYSQSPSPPKSSRVASSPVTSPVCTFTPQFFLLVLIILYSGFEIIFLVVK